MLTNHIFYLANNKPKDLFSAINYYNILIETINYLKSSQRYKENMKMFLETIKQYYYGRLNPYEFNSLSNTIDFIKLVIEVLWGNFLS